MLDWYAKQARELIPAKALQELVSAESWDEIYGLVAATLRRFGHDQQLMRQQLFASLKHTRCSCEECLATYRRWFVGVDPKSLDAELTGVSQMNDAHLYEFARVIPDVTVDAWSKQLGIPRWAPSNHAADSVGRQGVCTLGHGACPNKAEFSMREEPAPGKAKGNRHAICRNHLREWLAYWQKKTNKGLEAECW